MLYSMENSVAYQMEPFKMATCQGEMFMAGHNSTQLEIQVLDMTWYNLEVDPIQEYHSSDVNDEGSNIEKYLDMDSVESSDTFFYL